MPRNMLFSVYQHSYLWGTKIRTRLIGFKNIYLNVILYNGYIPKFEEFSEFASDKTQKISTLNCPQNEHCGWIFSITGVDASLIYIYFGSGKVKWERDSSVSKQKCQGFTHFMAEKVCSHN
jgi:hypothetical protein